MEKTMDEKQCVRISNLEIVSDFDGAEREAKRVKK